MQTFINLWYLWGGLIHAFVTFVYVANKLGNLRARTGQGFSEDQFVGHVFGVGFGGSIFWPISIVIFVMMRIFQRVENRAQDRVLESAQNAEKLRDSLLSDAKYWDSVAAQEGQLDGSRAAAMAMAKEKRSLAEKVEVPKRVYVRK